jgi:hypothetical protein
LGKIEQGLWAVSHYSFKMEKLINFIGLFLFLLALATMALIFRDAFPLLSSDDQTTFRHWIGRKFRLQSRAIDSIWNVHVRSYPRSRKRMLFISFLIGSAVLVAGYRLWLVLVAQ